MTRDDIMRLAEEAQIPLNSQWFFYLDELERFADLVVAAERESFIKDTRDEEIALLKEEVNRLRFCTTEGDAAAAMEYLAYCVEKAVAAEREKVAQWMISKGYSTGHGDTTEDLLKELEWQIREQEREACAEVATNWRCNGMPRRALGDAIRARGEMTEGRL